MKTLYALPLVITLCIVALMSSSSTAQSQTTTISVSWGPSGDLVAVGYNNGVVEVYEQDMGQFESISSFQVVPDLPLILTWNDNESQIIATGFGRNATVWDVQSGTLLATLDVFLGSLGAAWTPDGTRIFVWVGDAGSGRSLAVWDATTFTLIERNDFGDNIMEAVPSPLDSSQFILVNAGGYIGIGTLDPITHDGFDVRTQVVTSVAWHPTAQYIVSGNGVGMVQLWNIPLSLHSEFDGNRLPPAVYDFDIWSDEPIRDVQFTTDGLHIESIAADGTFRRWRLSDGALVLDTTIQFDGDAAAFSPDGNYLALSMDGEMQVLDAVSLNSPSNLAVTSSSPVGLSWQDNSVDEDGFIVSRQIDGGDWQDIATLLADTTTYIDVACGALAYRVRATRTSPLPLDSIPSNEVSVVVPCNEPTLSTHRAGAATGPTTVAGSCTVINVTVQADYVDQVDHVSTFRIEDVNGNVYRQTETTIDPTALNPRLGNSVILNYGLMVQGGDPNNHNAAPTPLPATTYWRWRVENSITGACQRIVVEVNCTTGVATITENTSTCELPPAGPLVPPPPPPGGGGNDF